MNKINKSFFKLPGEDVKYVVLLSMWGRRGGVVA